MEAYPLDIDQTHMNNLDANNEINDPYLIQRLQILLAASKAANNGNDSKRSSSSDHIINARLAIHRRPGLIRLRKSN
jgi:hypothetical protein